MSTPFAFADPAALLALPNGAVVVRLCADDLAQGQRFQACQCPIGLALSRQFGIPNWNITVANGDVFVRDNSGRVMRWWRMDEEGRGFRHFWDCGQKGQQPITFTLIPQPVPFMDVEDCWRTPVLPEVQSCPV